MKKNDLYIEIKDLPLRVSTTKNGIVQKEYLAIKTRDNRGIVLNGFQSAPANLKNKLK